MYYFGNSSHAVKAFWTKSSEKQNIPRLLSIYGNAPEHASSTNGHGKGIREGGGYDGRSPERKGEESEKESGQNCGQINSDIVKQDNEIVNYLPRIIKKKEIEIIAKITQKTYSGIQMNTTI